MLYCDKLQGHDLSSNNNIWRWSQVTLISSLKAFSLIAMCNCFNCILSIIYWIIWCGFTPKQPHFKLRGNSKRAVNHLCAYFTTISEYHQYIARPYTIFRAMHFHSANAILHSLPSRPLWSVMPHSDSWLYVHLTKWEWTTRKTECVKLAVSPEVYGFPYTANLWKRILLNTSQQLSRSLNFLYLKKNNNARLENIDDVSEMR